MIIDVNVNVKNGAEPRAWAVSKINRVDTRGILNLTFKQDKFNQLTDVIEYENPDDPTSIVGMWADLKNVPDPQDTPSVPVEYRTEITYSGIDPSIKIGGSYKKLTVKFYDSDEEIAYQEGEWAFMVDDTDVSDLITVKTHEDDSNLEENQIKISFKGDSSYIGKVLTITYTTLDGRMSGKLLLKIIGL